MHTPQKMTTLLAEEVGWHLGDGSMNWYNGKGLYQLRGHMIDDREHYVKRIRPTLTKLFDIDVHLREMRSTGVFGFQVWSDDLIKYKQSLGLPVGPKGECFFPQTIAEKKQFVIAGIRGVFDTDGMLFLEKKRGTLYPRIEIKQTSQILALQIQTALIDAGFRATRYSDHRGRGLWKPLAVVSVRGHELLHKWMKVIRPENQKHTNKYKRYCEWYKHH